MMVFYRKNRKFVIQKLNKYIMPIVSKKGKQMPESPIRKLVPFSDIAKSKGNKVYHLNIGQPDIATPEVAMNSIKNLDIKVLEYSHSAGFESYRRKLSAYYRNHNLPINEVFPSSPALV